MVHRNNGHDRIANMDTGLDSVSLLKNRVRKVLESDELWRSNQQVIRVHVNLNSIDPIQWLNSQPTNKKVYWKGRFAVKSIAGIGVADEIISSEFPSNLRHQFNEINQHTGDVRYFGGIRFDPRYSTSEEWKVFSASRFFLPRFELITQDETASLVCNLILPRDKRNKWTILRELSEIKLPAHPVENERLLPITRSDLPDKKAWCEILEEVIGQLEGNADLEKIVMARKVTFHFSERVDRLALFKRLTDITSNHFHFYFQFGSEYAFMGASPERLYNRTGRYIESEAIAGTGKRSDDGVDDSLYADALLGSEKDQREHAFVRNSILRSMDSLCSEMEIDPEPSVLDLNMGRHLKSKFWGRLKRNISDLDILNNLHPTSAVGGVPTVAALDTISELEPFDRGWYAGPVGWIGADSAEFSVGIRSALTSEDQISLFSGAGIVRGSTPENEWLEVEQKNSDFIKVLGLDQRSIKY